MAKNRSPSIRIGGHVRSERPVTFKRNQRSKWCGIRTMQGRFEKRGDVGIIWVNNPPVNAISVGVRSAIVDGAAKLAQDAEIKIGVLACEGRTFMAGADITEFGKPPLSPRLHEAINDVERS